MKIGNISKRPISIRIEHTHMSKSERMFQHWVGPNSPKAGPTLLTHEIDILSASLKCSPLKLRKIVPMRMLIINKDMNASSVCRTLMLITLPLSLTGSTA